jgi:hypothetical protein
LLPGKCPIFQPTKRNYSLFFSFVFIFSIYNRESVDVIAVNIIFYCFLIVIVRILCCVYYHFMFMSTFLSAIQILSSLNNKSFVVVHCRNSRVLCGVVC